MAASLMSALPGSVAQGLIWGILAIGVYITYKVLDFADLTVDGSLATGGAVAVMCMINGMHPYLALFLAFCAGMLAGLVTGLFHTALGIPPILSGILTQLGLYSINMRIMGKANQAISVVQYDLIVSLRYIPHACLVTIGFCVVIIGLLYWFFGTEIGAGVRATGCNPNMARAQGVNTNAYKVLGLVLSNGLVGLSGALYAQYQGSSDINMGRGAIVIGLAAVIIGEVIFGKIFHNFALHMVSAVIGAIIYFVVIAVVLQLGLETTDLKLFSALIVALFLAIPYLKGKYFSQTSKKGGNADA
ncbi:MAG: ABC transporter permease [Lachnospiraceae bacterium]|nr:ABC transporter permease [Lachnospiraceae bacterium]MDD6182621.1 ABC transporter permease [Lachnospiraceae bacterium]MDD7378611.1 ABC transporter permease [Lachnospiraceae bacterium]MDY4617672.1 ABC transporter permease [Lachnospiraceae bacterium]MDY5775294.1 ABC transporter permease [Lachnospiraceae bacterium]